MVGPCNPSLLQRPGVRLRRHKAAGTRVHHWHHDMVGPDLIFGPVRNQETACQRRDLSISKRAFALESSFVNMSSHSWCLSALGAHIHAVHASFLAVDERWSLLRMVRHDSVGRVLSNAIWHILSASRHTSCSNDESDVASDCTACPHCVLNQGAQHRPAGVGVRLRQGHNGRRGR